jgi:hypothetical protein
MKRYIVDRFEGKYAVCEDEDGLMINMLKSTLPDTVKEGSCLIIQEDGSVVIDESEYKRRSDDISKLMEDLFE